MNGQKVAAQLLKSELKRRGVSYRQLACLLQAEGLKETEFGLKNKINRGTFQMAFFLQCANVLSIKTLPLEDLEEL